MLPRTFATKQGTRSRQTRSSTRRESRINSADSTAFQGSAQRVRVSDWIADAKVTISTYGKEFQFTGRADMLFSRFEKYVEMVSSLKMRHVMTAIPYPMMDAQLIAKP